LPIEKKKLEMQEKKRGKKFPDLFMIQSENSKNKNQLLRRELPPPPLIPRGSRVLTQSPYPISALFHKINTPPSHHKYNSIIFY
jgi:hypothetical protein